MFSVQVIDFTTTARVYPGSYNFSSKQGECTCSSSSQLLSVSWLQVPAISHQGPGGALRVEEVWHCHLSKSARRCSVG